MSKLAYLVDMFRHLNKLIYISAGVLHKYLCTEKQDRRIQKEAGPLG